MKHLLYVEDDKIDQIAFRRIMFDMKEIRYTVVSYVEEALAIDNIDQFDLIITDYLLSDGSAHEVIEHFTPKPILVITGSLRPYEHETLLSAGATAYISKPLEKSTFIPLITQILQQVDSNETDFDLSYLKELSQGDEEFEKEMLEIFLEEVPDGLQQLEQLLNQHQWRQASHVVHRLKSKIRLLGMQSAKARADEIENNLKHETNLTHTQALINEMTTSLREGVNFVNHLLSSSHELSNH